MLLQRRMGKLYVSRATIHPYLRPIDQLPRCAGYHRNVKVHGRGARCLGRAQYLCKVTSFTDLLCVDHTPIQGIYPTIVVLTAMYDSKERPLLDSAQISHAMRFADGDKAHGDDTRATMDDDFALSGPSTDSSGSIEPSIRMYDMPEVYPSSHGGNSEGVPGTSTSQ